MTLRNLRLPNIFRKRKRQGSLRLMPGGKATGPVYLHLWLTM